MIAREKRLVSLFKTFVSSILAPIFNSNSKATSQWEYFSKTLSQQPLDINALQLYVDRLLQTKPKLFSASLEQSKTSEIRSKNPEQFVSYSSISPEKLNNDMVLQLNRTMGGNQRGRIATLFPPKSLSPISTQYVGFKAPGTRSPGLKISTANPSILFGMEQIYKTLSENQIKFQTNSLQMSSRDNRYNPFQGDKFK